jgi:hypothetical protein
MMPSPQDLCPEMEVALPACKEQPLAVVYLIKTAIKQAARELQLSCPKFNRVSMKICR